MDSFVVSTEDQEIMEVSRSYGADVLERPAELSGDAVLSRDVVSHAARVLGGDVMILLQCTSPIRRKGLIDRVIKAYGEGGFDSISTGFEHLNYPPFGTEHRRQDLHTVFVNDGSVIATARANLENETLFGRNPGAFVTTREENVDIDAEFDFWLAEELLKKGLREGWMTEPVKVK
jgi:CMP-N-acetylneuraminic acid synthetase